MDDIFAQLAEPFHPKRIHWRVGPMTQDRSRGIPLAYVDARDVMERLDAVVGPENWGDYYVETRSGRIICELSITVDGNTVTKSDGAGDTGTEGEKGAISDAFKRAAVKFGVGRYLYSIKAGWVELDNGKIPQSWVDNAAPKLLPTYKPSIFNAWMKFTEAVLEHSESIKFIKEMLDEDQIVEAKDEYQRVPNEDWLAINRAYTKGGVFTTEQTAKIKGW